MAPPPSPVFCMSRIMLAKKISMGAACASILLLLTACGKSDSDVAKKDAAKKGPPPAIPVTVLTAEPRRVPIVLEAVGQAEGSRDVEIRARVSGILEKRLYSEGAPV